MKNYAQIGSLELSHDSKNSLYNTIWHDSHFRAVVCYTKGNGTSLLNDVVNYFASLYAIPSRYCEFISFEELRDINARIYKRALHEAKDWLKFSVQSNGNYYFCYLPQYANS